MKKIGEIYQVPVFEVKDPSTQRMFLKADVFRLLEEQGRWVMEKFLFGKKKDKTLEIQEKKIREAGGK